MPSRNRSTFAALAQSAADRNHNLYCFGPTRFSRAKPASSPAVKPSLWPRAKSYLAKLWERVKEYVND